MRFLFQRAGRFLMLATATLAAAAPAWGQCAMCKAAAGSQKASAILALNKGIILLGIPPAAIILGMVWLTFRYRNAPRGQGTPVSSEKRP